MRLRLPMPVRTRWIFILLWPVGLVPVCFRVILLGGLLRVVSAVKYKARLSVGVSCRPVVASTNSNCWYREIEDVLEIILGRSVPNLIHIYWYSKTISWECTNPFGIVFIAKVRKNKKMIASSSKRPSLKFQDDSFKESNHVTFVFTQRRLLFKKISSYFLTKKSFTIL